YVLPSLTEEPWFPPLAPLPSPAGTLFRVLCRDADTLHLLLYNDATERRPARTVTLDARTHRKGEIWEILVEGAAEGQLYAWAKDPELPLLDPYALLATGPTPGDLPPLKEANRGARFKSVVVGTPDILWERPVAAPRARVVYELHVRGFTKGGLGGTYGDLAAKAPYLRDLGVTAVELLPVHQFDVNDVRRDPGLVQFWGYNPIAWFAPHRGYATADPIAEFRGMVRAFHAAGISVILDVVFNHTGELDSEGPTFSWRGLADEVYYLRELRTGEYANFTGCGNTARAQHPAMRAMIRHALRWWMHGMGVDGFRFDLASVLARDVNGAVTKKPPLLREIEEDPWLREATLVAEAWDAADGYLVGAWPGGPRWSVWNDRFRDDVRRAWLGPDGDAALLATRLSGSSDLFKGFGPQRSLNFVTCHDGFTLMDAVSYARRHNEANMEGSRDGNANEVSANHGVEGPSDDPVVRLARDRARRNLVATLLLAQGVPMLLGGDEMGRTQRGNNNAYCQDNAISWVDWTGLDRDRDFFRFVRGLNAFRRDTPELLREKFLTDDDVTWFGADGKAVDWKSGAFGYHLKPLTLVLVNLTDAPVPFALPAGLRLRLVADTAAAPPGDLIDGGTRWEKPDYEAAGKSLVLFRASPRAS
ncbi:MAG: glycogen debranching protein, partial [Planctomycetota bacterium]